MNKKVMGYFNRISLAFMLRTNYSRKVVEAGYLEADALIWDSSSEMVGSGQILDVFAYKTEWICQ